jgi:hypothetical protein
MVMSRLKELETAPHKDLVGNYEMQCRHGEEIRLHRNIGRHRVRHPNHASEYEA